MGSKQTKVEDSNILKTPVTQRLASSFNINTDNCTLDPRSPAECRTPIYLQNKRVGNTNALLNPFDMPEREANNQNSLDVLRKRFFKHFSYNFHDPRSPSLNFNRTPLVFEDTVEKSLCLDDTFADLFVESRLPETVDKLEQLEEKADEKYVHNEMPEENVIIDLEEPAMASKTPIALQQEFDPRSPSIGLERTPIIFTDDEANETNEDAMLENILATLSLNLNVSGNSSVISMATQNVKANVSDKIDPQLVPKLMNKHLDRVRDGKNTFSKAKHPKTKLRPPHQKIYEDQENHFPTTPKLKASQADKNDSLNGKRTPLSCVRNRNGTFSRSRSVESSAKSIKTRLALTSFDDTLNPTEVHKFPNSQGSLDL